MAWDYEFDTETIKGSTNPRLLDDKITTILKALSERLDADHFYELTGTQVSNTDAGKHRKITFKAPLTENPDPGENKGALYLKDVDSKAELHFEDEDNNVIQITSQGVMMGSALSADTEAHFLAKTTSGDYDGQIKCGSDHNAIWRWDATNEVWVKVSEQTKIYTDVAGDTLGTTADVKVNCNSGSEDIAIKVNKGESVIFKITVIALSSSVITGENRDLRVYLKNATSGNKLIGISPAAGRAMALIPDGTARTVYTGLFLDSEPVNTAEYVEQTYNMHAWVSGGWTSATIESVVIEAKIIRTSSI